MNKTLIAMAVAGVLAAPLAQADATVYGKVHLSVGAVSDETGSTTTEDNFQLRSHASRLGFKGSADLEHGLKAVYKLEYEVDPDTSSAGQGSSSASLKRRNQYIGLAGGFGTVLFGRHDTPTKIAQGKFDEFNDTDADIKGKLGISRGENRVDNVLAYVSPDFSGFTGAIALVPGEGDGTSVGDGLADTFSLMGQYKWEGLFVSFGYDAYDDTGYTGDSDLNLMRGVITYSMDAFQVGGLFEASDVGTEKDVYGVSGHYNIGMGKIKLQYMVGTEKITAAGIDDTEQSQVSVGYDHKLGDKTTAYVMYTDASTDEHGTTSDRDYSFAGVGMIHNF